MRDPLDEAYYNAQLKQWLADQEHDYDAASVNRLAPILANMEKNTLLPSERIKMGFMKDIASGDNGALLPSIQKGLASSFDMYSANDTATGNIKDARAYAEDAPGMRDYTDKMHHDQQTALVKNEYEYALRSAQDKARAMGLPLPSPADVVPTMDDLNKAALTDPTVAYNKSLAQAKGTEHGKQTVRTFEGVPDIFDGYLAADEQLTAARDNILKAKAIIAAHPTSSTGMVGTFAKFMPETEASALANHITMADSASAIGTLKALKDASKTGSAGMGTVSDADMTKLQSLYGQLSQDLSAKQLSDVFDQIEKHTKAMLDRNAFHQKNAANKIELLGKRDPDEYLAVKAYVERARQFEKQTQQSAPSLSPSSTYRNNKPPDINPATGNPIRPLGAPR